MKVTYLIFIAVQLIRNVQYVNSSDLYFRGLVLQMRAGSPPLPVGQFQFDNNANANLPYDYTSNFKFLQCPRPVNPLFPNGAQIVNHDNSVTHNSSIDKLVTRTVGPVFTWRANTTDGVWDPNTGYGLIHAK